MRLEIIGAPVLSMDGRTLAFDSGGQPQQPFAAEQDAPSSSRCALERLKLPPRRYAANRWLGDAPQVDDLAAREERA